MNRETESNSSRLTRETVGSEPGSRPSSGPIAAVVPHFFLPTTASVLVALMLALSGCAPSTAAYRAPVEEGRQSGAALQAPDASRTGSPASTAPQELATSPRPDPIADRSTEPVATLQPITSPPAPGPAVIALLETAERQQAAGQLASAAASLERALRIEPQSAWTWYQLAVVRFKQGRLAQAEQLARRSESLAGTDSEVRARNWRLIALLREHRGDVAGAESARRRAEAFEP